MSSVAKVVKIIQPVDYYLDSRYWELRKRITELIVSKPDYILIDCQHIKFFGADGPVGFFLATKDIRKYGGDLVFCSLNGHNGQLKMMFEFCNFDQVWKIYPNREAFFAETGAIEVTE